MASAKPTTTTALRIQALVKAYPGLHLREVARQLKTSVALVEYHVPALEEAGSIEVVQDARNLRLFPADADIPKDAIIALRDGRRLHIALALLGGAASHSELAKKTGMGKSTLSFHLRRLEAANLIEKVDGQYQLIDPVHAAALIQSHQPTPNLLDRFSSLWSSVYRR